MKSEVNSLSLSDESISPFDLLIDDQESRYLLNGQIAW